MGGSSSPKTPQYNPAEIIAAEAEANRTNQTGPFGSSTWSNQGGRWTQDIQLSPEMQQVLGRVFNQAGQGMGPFSYGGLDSTGWGGPVGQQGDHLVGRKQQAQGMDYQPPRGQGLSRQGGFRESSFQPGGGQFREGGFTGSSFQPGGGQFREGGFVGGPDFRESGFQPGQGQFIGSAGVGTPDNAASARDAAALFGEFVPKPDEFDPMKFANVYNQMFGGRIYKG